MLTRWSNLVVIVCALVLLPNVQALADDDDDDSGGEFTLFGTATKARDPDNAANQVIKVVTNPSPTGFGGASRNLRVKIATLDHQLSFKTFFVGRSCGGGAPRMTLLVDANGDGRFVQAPTGPDFAAHGHVNPPLFAGCPMDIWKFEKLTAEGEKRWETTPLITLAGPTVCGPIGAVTTCTWDELEARVTATFPNHRIIRGFIVDDSCSFFPGSCGTAYYDLITIGNATLETWKDIQDTDGDD